MAFPWHKKPAGARLLTLLLEPQWKNSHVKKIRGPAVARGCKIMCYRHTVIRRSQKLGRVFHRCSGCPTGQLPALLMQLRPYREEGHFCLPVTAVIFSNCCGVCPPPPGLCQLQPRGCHGALGWGPARPCPGGCSAPLRVLVEEEGWLRESAGPGSMAPPGCPHPRTPMSGLGGSRG